MALRGKAPEEIQKRLKALFWGKEGVGKTTCAIQFPKPYLIDTERGAENKEYVDILTTGGGAVFQTSDFDELMAEVKELLTTKHDYKTLIIDPLTTVYDDLLLKAEAKHGTEFGKHVMEAGKSMKRLINLILRLDMNVILTCHAKNQYGAGMALMGETYDCYKKLGHLLDLVFEVQVRGKQRVGVVRKTRVQGFEEGDQFQFSYGHIADVYGRDILERVVTPEKLASNEQVSEVKRLIDLLKIDNETVDKWLSKANASSFEEMNEVSILRCIEFLNKKIKGDDK